MFIPSVHAMFRRSGKHSFKVILEITKQVYNIDQKKQFNVCFMAQAHVLKKLLTKNIRRARDLEDKILCPRVMATYAFFAIKFF